MDCIIDWSSWVTALASLVSAITAYALWKVSAATLALQSSVEAAKVPNVNIWYNGPISLTPKVFSSLSFINTGQTSLPIRTLRILGSDGQAMKFLFSGDLHGQHPAKVMTSIKMSGLSGMPQVNSDIILLPNNVYQAFFEIESGQFKVEVMYYDNTFEFMDIDTSILGGEYILTGKGKK